MMKAPWAEVQRRIVDDAFFGHDEARIAGEQDLLRSGLLDSLAMVLIVEILAEMSGNESVVMDARQADFQSLESIHRLYEGL